MANAWHKVADYQDQSAWAGLQVQEADVGWITNSAGHHVEGQVEIDDNTQTYVDHAVGVCAAETAKDKKARRDFYGAFTERTLAKTGQLRTVDKLPPRSVASIERRQIFEWHRWVDLTHRTSEASSRLFCFPWAGGNDVVYGSWRARLPGVEIIPILLPGRQMRAGEPALSSVVDIVTFVVEAVCGLHLLTHEGTPFGVFGHELGALVAFEFCRKVHNDFPADALFVSGMRCPQMVHTREKLSDLCEVSSEGEVLHSKNREFEDAVMQRSEISPEISENTELVELFTPLWYADWRAMDTYEYHGGPLLKCPIYSFGGRSDGEQSLNGWDLETSSDKNICRLFSGGCYYLLDSENEAQLLECMLNFFRKKSGEASINEAKGTDDSADTGEDSECSDGQGTC